MSRELKELVMKLSDSSSNPIDIIWACLKDLWGEGAKKVVDKEWTVGEYYNRCGQRGSLLERQLEKLFFEIYSYLLEETKKESRLLTLFPQQIPATIIMDSLSLREASLLAEEVGTQGYTVKEFTYGTSSAPSDTDFFRKKVFSVKGLGGLRRLKSFDTIAITQERDLDTVRRIQGPTLIWSSFPDNLFEAGGLRYDSIYEKTKQVLSYILTLKLETVIVTSDHGYLAESERWGLPEKHSKLFQRNFKANRWALKKKLKANVQQWIEDLPEETSYFVSDKEYVYVRGRYMWMTRGKLPTSFHGGVSPMEVLTPFIILRREN